MVGPNYRRTQRLGGGSDLIGPGAIAKPYASKNFMQELEFGGKNNQEQRDGTDLEIAQRKSVNFKSDTSGPPNLGLVTF